MARILIEPVTLTTKAGHPVKITAIKLIDPFMFCGRYHERDKEVTAQWDPSGRRFGTDPTMNLSTASNAWKELVETAKRLGANV